MQEIDVIVRLKHREKHGRKGGQGVTILAISLVTQSCLTFLRPHGL